MSIEDPVINSIYSALALLPNACLALEDTARHDQVEPRYRRLTDDLAARAHKQHVFAAKDLHDLDALVSVLKVLVDDGTEQVWVHDEHCMAGGWSETVRSPAIAVLAAHHLTLVKLQGALQEVRHATHAHRLCYQWST